MHRIKLVALLALSLLACGMEDGAPVEAPPPACDRPPCPSRHGRQLPPDPRAVVPDLGAADGK